jgi:glycosyltransferase involved in cell wall biosynthesis
MEEVSKKPLVVIRCIAYNNEPYIRDCLNGFLMQKTKFPFVAVVHDDASTDKTADIIREYAEKYPDIIKPIYETENQYSKHDGSLGWIMDAAVGMYDPKYIAFCEGDDYWVDSKKLQRQVSFMENNDDYVLNFTNFDIDENGQIRPNNLYPVIPANDIYDVVLLTKGNQIATLTALIRKTAFDKLEKLWRRKEFAMGDYPRWIELSRMGKFKYLSIKTANYRVLKSSASHFTDPRKEIAFYESVLSIQEFYIKHYKINFDLNIIEKHFLYSAVKIAFKYQDREMAQKYYRIASKKRLSNAKSFVLMLFTCKIHFFRNLKNHIKSR